METISTRYAQAVCFVAVAEAGSFTAAAERLGCSKAQASKWVRGLEEALGVQLLMRTTRRLALTEAGRVYLEHCRTLREVLDEGERAVSAVSREIGGTLRITAPTSFGETFLCALLLAFRSCHPQLRIELDLSIAHRDLLADGYDFAFRTTRTPDGSLVSRTLAVGADAIVASPAFLCDAPPLRVPGDLVGVECLCNSHLGDDTDWAFSCGAETVSVAVAGHFSANHFGTLREAAIAGAGVARLPAALVAEAIERGALVRLLEAYETIPTPLCLVYPQRRHMPYRNRVFRDFVVDWFADPVRAQRFA